MTHPERDEAAEERTQYLSIEVAGVEYGLPVLGVREVLQLEHVTPVPSVPRAVRGVINLRGSVLPVLDLAVRFGLPAAPDTRRTCIVIAEVRLEGQPTAMGLLVDAVKQVIELGPDEVQPPPPFGANVRVEYLVGVGRAEAGRVVLLLDVDRVVAGAGDVATAALAGAVGVSGEVRSGA